VFQIHFIQPILVIGNIFWSLYDLMVKNESVLFKVKSPVTIELCVSSSHPWRLSCISVYVELIPQVTLCAVSSRLNLEVGKGVKLIESPARSGELQRSPQRLCCGGKVTAARELLDTNPQEISHPDADIHISHYFIADCWWAWVGKWVADSGATW